VKSPVINNNANLRSYMRLITGILLVASATSAQLVSLPDGYCEHQKIKPNLHVASETTIVATMKDRTGEVFKNTPIELRRFVTQKKQEPIGTTTTDSKGEFKFPGVAAGEYRMLVLDVNVRGFRQPGEMWCKTGETCVLEVVLEVMPTDQPESQCPVK
jgi:hypothetical protein